MKGLVLEQREKSRTGLVDLLRRNYPEIFIDEVSSLSELKEREQEDYDVAILGRDSDGLSERETLRNFIESENSSEVIIVYGDSKAERTARELGARFFERGIPSERKALEKFLKTLSHANYQIS